MITTSSFMSSAGSPADPTSVSLRIWVVPMSRSLELVPFRSTAAANGPVFSLSDQSVRCTPIGPRYQQRVHRRRLRPRHRGRSVHDGSPSEVAQYVRAHRHYSRAGEGDAEGRLSGPVGQRQAVTIALTHRLGPFGPIRAKVLELTKASGIANIRNAGDRPK